MNDPIYAVVDIETTGTNIKVDRIIQIGCVLVQNGKIISRFASDINPRIKITKQIESLTGISNKQVANAPYFEDVASKIYQLLQGCVFVAHNVYFDYQFLSYELNQAGVGSLTIAGIDTVELAQIILPTASSFRLSDLAEQLGIAHDRPHQADSDAEVTAFLLLYLEEKLMGLPLVTLQKLVELSDQCGMDTGNYIELKYQEALKAKRNLAEGLYIVEGIALQKKIVKTFDYQAVDGDYPKTKAKKEALYNRKLTYRESQGKMMNLVYSFFNKEEGGNEKLADKNLALESSTGSGKTLGYLLPLSYLATPENPVVVSTVSILLEHQLLEQGVPLVNQIRPDSLKAVLVKSPRHFLNLENFHSTLLNPVKQKQYALYQMGILVWLTETKTGDLGELNLSSTNHLLFTHVKHQGEKYLSVDSHFYEVDFWRHLQEKMRQSNVIVVNHAFLCQENVRETPYLPKSDFLIIDEAHHLPEIAQRVGTERLTDYSLRKLIYELTVVDSTNGVLKKITSDRSWQVEIRSLVHLLKELSEVVEEVVADITETVLIDNGHKYNEEVLITNQNLFDLPQYFQEDLEQLLSLLREGNSLSQRISDKVMKDQEKWTKGEYLTLLEWMQNLSEFERMYDFIHAFRELDKSNYVRWLRIKEKNQLITVYLSDLRASLAEGSNWYTRYTNILYTGGTIRVGKDTQYLSRSLGLDSIPFKSLPNAFDYSKQAKVYIPTESFDYRDLNSREYVSFIASTIKELSRQEKRSILVLFTSHEILRAVYQNIHFSLLMEGIEVLAQGISGTREKITKRFSRSKSNILLGTDSFWEGVDIPGEHLEIIIVTRLPFESPERPFVKEKYDYLQKMGINPFYKYALPKATLRLRQALGRLIRSENDKGVMMILDYRIAKASYGPRMLNALPKNLPIVEGPLEDLLKDLKDFLKTS